MGDCSMPVPIASTAACGLTVPPLAFHERIPADLALALGLTGASVAASAAAARYKRPLVLRPS